MHIWTSHRWQKYYDNINYRQGLRLICDKNIDPEVRRSCKEFCKWLRQEYFFPIRIPVYLKEKRAIRANDGELVSATIFLPFQRSDEPYIRVAVGDYMELLGMWGKDNALGAILCSIAHELTHYYQWVNNIQLTDIGKERQAKRYAIFIIDEYKDTRDHP
ncbi:MAG: hypothetical protein FWG31_02740 [Oscillospiraceae bacterium]|nr:hypothetical protein [Oscillospiraceae bacterium]